METPGGRRKPPPFRLTRYTVPMTTQTSPADNEHISHLEGVVEQILARLDSLERGVDSLRSLMFKGFGLLWATMVGGFIAILTINP